MEGIEKFLPQTEEDLIIILEVIHVIGALVILFTILHPIPYGRYSNSSVFKLTGWTVSGLNLWRTFSLTWLFPVLMMFFTPSRMLIHLPNIIAIFLFLAHYVYRSLIYPVKYMKNASPWPLESALLALLSCSFNGFIQGFHLTNVYRVGSIGITSVIGLLLFITGLLINIAHDEILAGLRKQRGFKKNPGTNRNSNQTIKYSIPRGGLFDYISAANYFGEIIEWWGWAIFTRGFPQIIFAITTTSIIGVRGWQHHKFYKKTFGKAYPTNRRAIIPFIF